MTCSDLQLSSAHVEAELATILDGIGEGFYAVDRQWRIRRFNSEAARHFGCAPHEAIAAVGEHRPDLVLADIQLADGSSGLEAVQEILQSVDVPVIFITAYPERLLTGELPEPTYLVEKPFRPESVKALMSQALFFHSPRRRRGD